MTPRRRFLAARLGYVAIVLLATLTQLNFSPDLTAAAVRLARAFTPSLGWRDAIDGLRNTVLFAGLGVTWVMTSLSGRVGAEVERATLVGLGLSVTVDGVQLFSPIRTASIVDVSTNTLGALAGALVVAYLVVALHRARNDRSYLGVPMFLPAGSYGLAALCEALDRKSTRLNSSHLVISYAVFCLKKKKTKNSLIAFINKVNKKNN